MAKQTKIDIVLSHIKHEIDDLNNKIEELTIKRNTLQDQFLSIKEIKENNILKQ